MAADSQWGHQAWGLPLPPGGSRLAHAPLQVGLKNQSFIRSLTGLFLRSKNYRASSVQCTVSRDLMWFKPVFQYLASHLPHHHWGCLRLQVQRGTGSHLIPQVDHRWQGLYHEIYHRVPPYRDIWRGLTLLSLTLQGPTHRPTVSALGPLFGLFHKMKLYILRVKKSLDDVDRLTQFNLTLFWCSSFIVVRVRF